MVWVLMEQWRAVRFPFYSLCTFFFVFLYLYWALPGIQTLDFDIESGQSDELAVIYSTRQARFAKINSLPVRYSSGRTRISSHSRNGYFNFAQVHLARHPGRIRLYSITAYSYFHPVQQFTGAQLATLLQPVNEQITVRNAGEYVEIESRSVRPMIDLTVRPFPHLWMPAVLVAGIAAGVVLLIGGDQTPGGSHPKHTGKGKNPILRRYPGLDGLRGLAAVLVIADHTWSRCTGLGATGVYLFFALSGFLLTLPWAEQPQQVFSRSSWSQYFYKRCRRILPMYYFYLFLAFGLSNRFDLFFMHALFVQGDGHLWAMAQEILFYIFLPLVLLPVLASRKQGAWWPVVLVLLLILGWDCLAGQRWFWLLGMNHQQVPLFIDVFWAGVLFALLYTQGQQQGWWMQQGSLFPSVLSLLGLMLLLFFLLGSTGYLYGKNLVYAQEYEAWYGVLAALLVFCVAFSPRAFLGRALSHPMLCWLGRLGLSVYLLHPMVKGLIENFMMYYFQLSVPGCFLFPATLVGSGIVASFTYAAIEKLPQKAGQKRVFCPALSSVTSSVGNDKH